MSVGLHTSLVAGLLYASVNRIITPIAVEAPMSVMLMPAEPQATEAAAPPQKAIAEAIVPEAIVPEAVVPEAVVPKTVVAQSPVKPAPPPEVKPQPVLVPEPPAPVHIAKSRPEPKPRPKSKPLRKIPEQTQSPIDQAAAQTPIFSAAQSPAHAQHSPVAPAVSAPAVNGGPVVVSRPDPIYPDRARVLGIEGRALIRFDVNASGQVENLQIISATPRNMFERGIREAALRWRYQSGKPGKNQSLTIIFTLSGVSTSAD